MQYAGKWCENRFWIPPQPEKSGDSWFAIHAGRTPAPSDQADRCFRLARRRPSPIELSFGAILGIARISEPILHYVKSSVLYSGELGRRPSRRLKQFGTEAEPKIDPPVRKWIDGPYAWPLEFRWLEKPIECRGYQKLWKVPDEIEQQLLSEFPKELL